MVFKRWEDSLSMPLDSGVGVTDGVLLFPTLLVRCTGGHEYCVCVPPWESRISAMECGECGGTVDTIRWGGMRPLK